jgi:hypothetical protein
MAVYFLRTKHLSRSKGARVTRAAAYRAGERIRDERTNEVYDHSDRNDIAYKEVVLPSDMANRPDMQWTQDRSTLWNTAEQVAPRHNSRLAREWLVFLPPELTPDQRTSLARTFAAELADKYRSAVDISFHHPRPSADPRNHHAHLLMTTREVTSAGLGPRTSLELGGRERQLLGVGGSSRQEYLAIRERWAQIANEALRAAGRTERIDHRSLQQQGIDREPTPTVPEKVFYAERQSQQPSPAGNEIRARHIERVAARLEGPAALASVVASQKAKLKERALEEAKRERSSSRPTRARTGPGGRRAAPVSPEEKNARRRERYQARRAREKLDAEGEKSRREAARQRFRDRMQKDPEAVRQARQRWRKENADEVNRKQRQYRLQNARELNSKRREHRKSRAESQIRIPSQLQATVPERAPSRPLSRTADESALRWKAFRESQGPRPTAEQSARNWLAYRENQRGDDVSRSPLSPNQPRRLERTRDAENDEARKPRRPHDHDLGK